MIMFQPFIFRGANSPPQRLGPTFTDPVIQEVCWAEKSPNAEGRFDTELEVGEIHHLHGVLMIAGGSNQPAVVIIRVYI